MSREDHGHTVLASGRHFQNLVFVIETVSVCLCVCVVYMCLCTTRVTGACRGQKRLLDVMELGIQTVVSYHTGAGNQA